MFPRIPVLIHLIHFLCALWGESKRQALGVRKRFFAAATKFAFSFGGLQS